MAVKNQFSGDSYDKSEFSPEERAALRHMWATIGADYIKLSPDTVEKMEGLANIANGAINLAKIISVAAPIGAAAAIWFRLNGGG